MKRTKTVIEAKNRPLMINNYYISDSKDNITGELSRELLKCIRSELAKEKDTECKYVFDVDYAFVISENLCTAYVCGIKTKCARLVCPAHSTYKFEKLCKK